MKQPWFLQMLAIVAVLALSAAPAAAEPPVPAAGAQPDMAAAQARLDAASGGQAEIALHAYTGKVRFLSVPAAQPIESPAATAAGATPEDAARGFLADYGVLFGVSDPYGDLTVMREQEADGRDFVRFQQAHAGIPVIGGELIVQMDARGAVISVNGEILPDISAPTTPAIEAENARADALALVAKHYEIAPEALETSAPTLWYYNGALLGAAAPHLTSLVWRVEVSSRDLLPIRELVLVDAQTGIVLLNFNQIANGKFRTVFDNVNDRSAGLPGYGPVRTEGSGPTGIGDVDKAYEYAGDTYDYFYSVHGRDSLDGFGLPLVSTVRYCTPDTNYACPYLNAFWNGAQMVYGQGFASADDVVAHELTHGVTEYESNLFYYMQSGAINESLSDIWGEFVDLTNGKGNDSAGVRWLMGEDLVGIGPFRSMSNPPTYGDPDRVGSTLYYCGSDDNGGVHWNSGISNKAASLMADGGSFNGKTVTALGITKTARIWYRAQTNLLTSAADFQDLHELLPQACTDQIGTNGITAADCQEVRDAVDATQMSIQPTACPAPEAPICDAGTVPAYLLFDSLEDPYSGRWQSSSAVGPNTWFYPQDPNPLGEPMHYGTSGQYHFWGWDASSQMDANIRTTTPLALPAGTKTYLHFNHAYSFETGAARYDGGVLEYSTNNGATWQDTGAFPAAAKVNWYNGSIYGGFGNPLGGRSAFTGASNGYTSSRLDLGALAGQNVRIRFRIGTDSSVADWGWFIDDIGFYRCVAPAGPAAFLPLILR